MPRLILFILLFFMGLPAHSAQLSSSLGQIDIEKVVDGLNQPWGLGFLPDNELLITERGGRLLHFDATGNRTVVSGTPQVVAKGQGGLLDVLIPHDFAETREIFLSFSKKQARGSATALAVGRLSKNGARLDGMRVIFEQASRNSGSKHFGSRIVQAQDGSIFLTIGERGDRPSAQDNTRHNGSVIRLGRDGSVPANNPFVTVAGNQPEIWSFGHRNPQGAAFDLQGQLWLSEHGARGGDEINRVQRGANFGWPVISYGRHYSGAKIGEGTAKEGMQQPAHYWDPSIAPSGLMIYSGKLWPQWRGHFFVGSLKFDHVARLDPAANWAEEVIQSPETGRVRDVREAPDGAIWFLSVTNGAAYRLSPAP